MAVSAERVAVGATAVALNTASTSGQALVVRNGATGVLDLGGSGVATGAGLSVGASEAVSVTLDPGDVLYGISDATGATVEVLRT